MSSERRVAIPEWIPTAEDWFAQEGSGESSEDARASLARGSAGPGDGGTQVVGICFRSWRSLGRWPRDLVAYLSAALSG